MHMVDHSAQNTSANRSAATHGMHPETRCDGLDEWSRNG